MATRKSTPAKKKPAAKRTSRVSRGGAVLARAKAGKSGSASKSNAPRKGSVTQRLRTSIHTLRSRRAELLQELGGIVALGFGALVLLSLLSHHPLDSRVGQWGDGDAANLRNWVGPFGAWISDLLVGIFGLTAFALPPLLALLAVRLLQRRSGRLRVSEALGFVGVVATLTLLVHLVFPSLPFRGASVTGGGALGGGLSDATVGNISIVGSWIVGVTGLLVSARLAFGVRSGELVRGAAMRVWGALTAVGRGLMRGVRRMGDAGAGGLRGVWAAVVEAVQDWRNEIELIRQERRWEREERLAVLDEDLRDFDARRHPDDGGYDGDYDGDGDGDGDGDAHDIAHGIGHGDGDGEHRGDGGGDPAQTRGDDRHKSKVATSSAASAAARAPSVTLTPSPADTTSGDNGSRRKSRIRMPSRVETVDAAASAAAARTPSEADLRSLPSVETDAPGALGSSAAAGSGERVDSMRGATSRGVVHAEIRLKGTGSNPQGAQSASATAADPADAHAPASHAAHAALAAPAGSGAPAPGGPAPDLRPRIHDSAPRELDEEARAQRRIISARHWIATTNKPYVPPALTLLKETPPAATSVDEAELEQQAARLETTLGHYGVEGRVTDILPGPVVTMFEFEPAPGIKVSRIANLENDLAMALRAIKVRIVAPIPGKGAVGIEIPSTQREIVYFREILASKKFQGKKRQLPLALGKGIDGGPVCSDMAKMPHILIAGTTGSGKSVCVNSIILSLLFSRSPDEVRLILVDPKMLEFSMYDGIPHLLVPVVTSPKKAAMALNWAVSEMTRRYTVLAAMNTRNIVNYNEKTEKMRAEWEAWELSCRSGKPIDKPDCGRAAGEDTVCWRSKGGDPVGAPDKMPYIVIIIDELADLMMVARKDVEESIVRLAQMARACGIHMLLATQRPSVDVITGLIKANFPTRLSFRVSSKVDSRTVLDANGAENLLGMGDGLFLPPGTSTLTRVHGAFISDEEAQAVVDHLKAQGEPKYVEAILVDPEEAGAERDVDEKLDSMYDQAVAVVAEAGKASTSLLQRRLKLGYNRAARIMDAMERQGVIGPQDGARPREVYASSFDD